LVHAPIWTSTSRDSWQSEFFSKQILVPVGVICASRRIKSRANPCGSPFLLSEIWGRSRITVANVIAEFEILQRNPRRYWPSLYRQHGHRITDAHSQYIGTFFLGRHWGADHVYCQLCGKIDLAGRAAL
jgi:hypothetical protein